MIKKYRVAIIIHTIECTVDMLIPFDPQTRVTLIVLPVCYWGYNIMIDRDLQNIPGALLVNCGTIAYMKIGGM